MEDIKQTHKDLAELFLDTWVGNKPLVSSPRNLQIIDTGCRYVCQQPLLYSEIKYNQRRLHELWYHLLQSGEASLHVILTADNNSQFMMYTVFILYWY